MSVTLTIEALGAGGDGFAHLPDGRAVFVQGGVPGDVAEVELLEEQQRQAHARLVRLVQPSAERVDPGCPHFEACGGCPWLGVSLRLQEETKHRLLREALERVGGLETAGLLRPLLSSPRALRYRQRTTLHLSGGRLGYRAAGSHELVPVCECRQLDERLEAAVLRLAEAIAEEGPPARGTDVALAIDGRRATAAFYVATAVRRVSDHLERLQRRAGLDGTVLMVEGARGQPTRDALLSMPAPGAQGVVLHGRADLFSQANAEGNARLVGEAMRMLGPAGPGGRLLELYAGNGNFTFAARALGWSMTTVESTPDAVELARRSAREAGTTGIQFVQGDALKVADALAREGQRFEALLLDPPRAGARGVAAVAAKAGVRRVVYVSCDPATLARDLKDLAAAGFVAREATPVDMFPQTFHLESVVVLEKR